MVYNPNAGRFPSQILAERAADVLRSSGWDIRIIKTDNGNHVTQAARKAAEQGKDVLFVVGGDGTVNLAVRGLAGSDTALGVLPGGTANVLAQELGLPGLRWTRWTALEEKEKGCSSIAKGDFPMVSQANCPGMKVRPLWPSGRKVSVHALPRAFLMSSTT